MQRYRELAHILANNTGFCVQLGLACGKLGDVFAETMCELLMVRGGDG